MNSTARQLQTTTKQGVAENAKNHMAQLGIKPGRMSKWSYHNIVRYLNLKPNPVTNRIQTVVESCRKVIELNEKILDSSTSGKKSLCDERDEALENLNARLAKYKWHPVVRPHISPYTNFVVQYEFDTTSDAAHFENRAVQWLMNHIALVHRIRRCRRLQCRKWFYAVTEHQKYCEANCRKRDAQQGPEFKRKRAAYMRDRYRPLQKKLDAQNLAAARQLAKGRSK